MSDKKPIFEEPVGPSEKSEQSVFGWNNMGVATDGATCDLCGTEWPKGETYIVCRFLGLNLVEKCCGRAIDVVYNEFGKEFALAFLEEFSRDPLASRFSGLRSSIEESLNRGACEAKALSRQLKSSREKIVEIEIDS